MARVLISFLGTGPLQDEENRVYRKAIYKIDNKDYETPFVSAALVSHLKIEKKIIIGTAKSMWEEYYRFFYSKKENYNTALYQKIINYTKKANSTTTDFTILKELESAMDNTHIIILKYGLNEDELRENISSVLEIDEFLDKKDNLYIDITHGFRSFPLLAQQVVFYLKEVSSKKLKPRNFYYGMLDANRELGYAPIVDLKIMFEMNDWILGANQFKTSTNGDIIVPLIRKKNEELANLLDSFSKAMNINYANEIQNQIKKLEKFDTTSIKNPEKLIVDKVIDEFINHFSNIKSQSSFQFELAKWYYNKNSFGSSYVILAESLISFICEVQDQDVFMKKNRDEARIILSDKRKKPYLSKKYIDLVNIYNKIKNIRNNISHNLHKRKSTHIEDIETLPKYFKLIKNAFKIK